jgi:Lrp/AsnC family transcriptional regulator for asnA, asnC and gidA
MTNRNRAFGPIDQEIFRLLQEDGRLPVAAVAERLDVPASTVRRRLSRLIEAGALRIVAIPDVSGIGLPIHAIIAIQTDAARRCEVGDALVALGEIRWVAMTAGQFDFVVEVLLASNDHFHAFLTEKLGRIPGIQRAETLTIVRHMKESYAWSAVLEAAEPYLR